MGDVSAHPSRQLIHDMALFTRRGLEIEQGDQLLRLHLGGGTVLAAQNGPMTPLAILAGDLVISDRGRRAQLAEDVRRAAFDIASASR